MYPAHVDSMKMGYIFEDIIRRFSENAEAGDHYTPREVIRLMVNVLLAEGCNDLLTDEGKIATVLDAACGSGGMLSTTYDFLRRKNPYVDVRLFGQEINPESYAICLADMLIKGQDVKNIMGDEEANTLKTDCFPDQKMRLVIMNPRLVHPGAAKMHRKDKRRKSVRKTRRADGLSTVFPELVTPSCCSCSTPSISWTRKTGVQRSLPMVRLFSPAEPPAVKARSGAGCWRKI